MTAQQHVGEAIEALGQYLGCVSLNRVVGWGDECLRDLQDHSRKAFIAATPCPVCERLGNLFDHGKHV